ncbi:MFS transporter [candidate division KSB1 bacterium]
MTGTSQQRHWFPVAMLMSAGHFVTDIFPGFLAPVLPLLMIRYDFSITFAGMLAAVSSLSSSFSQPLFGYLSDKIQRRHFVVLGPLFSALFYSSIGLMPDKYLLVVCVFIGGMGVAMFHPQAAKMVHQIGGNHKGRAISVFTTGGSIGYPLGALMITSLIIPFGGLEYAPVLIIPVPILVYFMIKYAPSQKNPDGEIASSKPKLAFRQISALSVFVSIGVMRSLVIMAFTLLVPFWYAQQGLPLQQGGYAIFVFHFFGGIGGLIGGFLSDKYSAKRIIAVSFLFGGLFLVLFIQTSGILSLLWLGCAGGMLYASIPAVITQAQAAMPVHMGTASSMVMGFSWGVGGVLVSVVSSLADIYGVYSTMFIMAFFPFLSLGLALLIKPQQSEKTYLPEYL